ncbi:hypothetical protein [Rhodomicrobium lacus]|uniref:hypothetical protein n=1 Tax=Rhodomicrobium lacus TaxID=2498452 RepID=UPI000F8C4971|nr:hypothetical protein [Rhodomicrobium lacus]
MFGYWEFRTHGHSIRIVPQSEKRWIIMDGDDALESHPSDLAALDALLAGSTCLLSDGINTAELGLPDDLSEWRFVRLR